MKWVVEFPEETILVVRPSLDDICYDIKPAAKLLSELLYRCSIRAEHQQDAHNMNDLATSQGKEATQDTTLRIYRTQAQLVENMIHEITEKTLHDVAVPTLQLLGYIDLEEYIGMNCYIVHVDMVQEALLARKQGQKELFLFQLTHLQLEKFLIDIELEKVLIDRKNFQLALEKVLIANRNTSNCKRGRKPKPEVPREPQSEEAQINKIDSKIGNREESATSLQEDRTAHATDNLISFEAEKKRKTEPRIPAVTPSHSQRLSEDDDPDKTEKMPITKPQQKVEAPHVPNRDHSNSDHNGSPAPDHGNSGLSQTPVAGSPPSEQATPGSPSGDGAQVTTPYSPTGQAPASNGAARASGKVIPRRPRTKKPVVLELTLEGMQVKGWYEQVRGSKLRMTEKNVQACNDLASIEDVTFDSLKATIEHLDGLTWVKEHDYPIDIQVLAGDGRLNFETNWPVVKRKLATQAAKESGKKDGQKLGDYYYFSEAM